MNVKSNKGTITTVIVAGVALFAAIGLLSCGFFFIIKAFLGYNIRLIEEVREKTSSMEMIYPILMGGRLST